MKKIISLVLICCFVFYLFGCSSTSGMISMDNPPAGASVDIKLIDGSTQHGVLLKKEGEIIKYISTDTKLPEDLELSRINSIQYSQNVYDLNGGVISDNDISYAKGSGKTIGYGIGGFLVGGLIGFGAGALFSSATDNKTALIYPIIGVGVIGGVFMGMKGSDLDRETAIDDIRMKRYETTKKELDEKEKELEKQKQSLEKLKE